MRESYFAKTISVVDELDSNERFDVTALMRVDVDQETNEKVDTTVGFVPLFPGGVAAPNAYPSNGTRAGFVVYTRRNVDSHHRRKEVVEAGSPDIEGLVRGHYKATEGNQVERELIKRALVANRMTRQLLARWESLTEDELALFPGLQDVQTDWLPDRPIDQDKVELSKRFDGREDPKDATGKNNPVAVGHKLERDARLEVERLKKNQGAAKGLEIRVKTLVSELDRHLELATAFEAFFEKHETVEEAMDDWLELYWQVRYQPLARLAGDVQGLVSRCTQPQPLVAAHARQILEVHKRGEEILRPVRPLGSLSGTKAAANADRYAETFLPMVAETIEILQSFKLFGQNRQWQQRLVSLAKRLRVALRSKRMLEAVRLARAIRNEFFCRLSDPTWCAGVPVGFTPYELQDRLNRPPQHIIDALPENPFEGLPGAF